MSFNSHGCRINGKVGVLECLLDGPAATEAVGCVVISHPHPLFDGSMHNKVVQTIARAYSSQGWLAVRFNFRGVGASQGSYDNGIGECDDLQAVIAELALKDKPLMLAGFSFGTVVTLRLLQQNNDLCRQIQGLTLAGVAAANFAVPAVPQELHDNTLVVHGQCDEVAPLPQLMEWAGRQKLPVVVLPGVSDFFHGNLVTLKQLVIKQIKVL